MVIRVDHALRDLVSQVVLFRNALLGQGPTDRLGVHFHTTGKVGGGDLHIIAGNIGIGREVQFGVGSAIEVGLDIHRTEQSGHPGVGVRVGNIAALSRGGGAGNGQIIVSRDTCVIYIQQSIQVIIDGGNGLGGGMGASGLGVGIALNAHILVTAVDGYVSAKNLCLSRTGSALTNEHLGTDGIAGGVDIHLGIAGGVAGQAAGGQVRVGLHMIRAADALNQNVAKVVQKLSFLFDLHHGMGIQGCGYSGFRAADG